MSCLYVGTQECFVCNHHLKGDESAPEKPLKCLVKDCGRFYHLSCLSSYQYAKIEGGSIVMCPLHVCETCASEEKNLKDPKSLKGEHPTSQFVLVICRLRFNICDVHTLTLCCLLAGRMFRCYRCPTAYHVGDMCIAAGSEHITNSLITCSKHYTNRKERHVNVSWCFACSRGKSFSTIRAQT